MKIKKQLLKFQRIFSLFALFVTVVNLASARPPCNARLNRVNAIDAPGNISSPFASYNIGTALFDRGNGNIYFSAAVSDGASLLVNRVFRVRTDTFNVEQSVDLAGQQWFDMGVGFIDENNGFAYYAGFTTHAVLIKFDLNQMSVVGTMDLDQSNSNFPTSAIFDPSTGYGYVAMSEDDNTPAILRVDTNDFLVDARLDLPTEDRHLQIAEIDSQEGVAYFSGWDFGVPGHLIKIDLGDFERVASLNLGTTSPRSMVLDSARNMAYMTVSGSVQQVLKINLQTMSVIGTIGGFPSGEFFDEDGTIILDPSGCYVYAGIETTGSGGSIRGARLLKIQQNNFTIVGQLPMVQDELALKHGVYESDSGKAFVTTHYGIHGIFARVVQLDLGTQLHHSVHKEVIPCCD